MLKFFALLTGDRYELIRQQDPISRKKVVTLGMGLLIVTGYWMVTGYTIGTQVLQLSIVSAFLLAAVCAGIVFGIDRTIVMTTGGGRWMVGGRVFLALILALLGGTALDLVVLRGEVEQELVVMHGDGLSEAKHHAAAAHQATLEQAKNAVQKAMAATQASEAVYLDEINGSYNGSGRYGAGKVAAEKKGLLEQHRATLLAAEQALNREKAALAAAEAQATAKLTRAQATPTLFERVHAMHRYVQRDALVLGVYVLFTLLLIGIELFPVLVKLGGKRTAYEMGLEAVHELRTRRTETLLQVQQAQLARQRNMSVTEREAMATLASVAQQHRSMN